MSVRNTLCTLFIARHGQTEWNLKRMIQGHRDIPLTPEGEKQAFELAKELKRIKFSAIFSSDLV